MQRKTNSIQLTCSLRLTVLYRKPPSLPNLPRVTINSSVSAVTCKDARRTRDRGSIVDIGTRFLRSPRRPGQLRDLGGKVGEASCRSREWAELYFHSRLFLVVWWLISTNSQSTQLSGRCWIDRSYWMKSLGRAQFGQLVMSYLAGFAMSWRNSCLTHRVSSR